MSREEAISLLKQVNHILVNNNSWTENTHEPLNTAFSMAIKALEEETIIDKIRAEIENLEEGISSYHNDRPWIYKDEVLQIIDKYKAEMERGK